MRDICLKLKDQIVQLSISAFTIHNLFNDLNQGFSIQLGHLIFPLGTG